MNNKLGMKDEEFLVIAKAMKAFHNNEITEKEFISIVNTTSAKYVKTILPSPDDYKLLSDANRIRSGNYVSKDVKGFVISLNDKLYNIYMDRYVISALAKAGDREAMERLAQFRAYEEALKREDKMAPKMPKDINGSEYYLSAIDEYYKERQEYIERKKSEILNQNHQVKR